MIENRNIISVFFAFTFLFISCKSKHLQRLDVSKNHPEKIRIYSNKHTLTLDKDFPGEVTISYIKVNFEENTLSFSKEEYLEGDKREIPNLEKLFKDSEKHYFLVTNTNEIEIPKYVSKYKRKWNDFATPGRSVTPAITFIISADSIRYRGSKKTKSSVLDTVLTQKINRQ